MKLRKLFFTITLFFYVAVIYSQINFGKEVIEIDQVPEYFELVDMNLDGDLDIVGINSDEGKLLIWHNDGTGTFIIEEIGDVDRGVLISIDFDLDGDLDILTGEWSFTNKINWWKNDGNGNFEKSEVEDFVRNIQALKVVDLDQDGDLDILGVSSTDDEVAWWENENFVFEKKSINTNINFGGDIEVGDFNQDNNLDIVASASGDDRLILLVNDGNEVFSETIIDEGIDLDGIDELIVLDINKDGFEDIICATTTKGTIVAFTNNNMGTFNKIELVDSIGNPDDFKIIDFNKDDNFDLVVADIGFGGSIRYYENIGDLEFTEISLSENIPGATKIDVGDIDLDNDVDFIGAGLPFSSSDELALWRNNTCQLDTIITNEQTCLGDTINWNGMEIYQSGEYTSLEVDSSGCTILDVLNLNFIFENSQIYLEAIVDSIFVNGVQSNASISWISCTTNDYVAGENSQKFIPKASDSYKAEIISTEGCIYLTDCINIILTSINSPQKEGLFVYPNPVKNDITLEIPNNIKIRKVAVYNNLGEEIELEMDGKIINLEGVENGIYWITIFTEGNQFYTKKVIKVR